MPRFIRLFDDYPVYPLTNIWPDLAGIQNREEGKLYAVQTSSGTIQRCLLMTTDPGDLVLDITCGSGTTAVVAEQWGRRWITCDTSRVALALAKQRLMTAVFDYYQLARPAEGVGSGFLYRTVPHVTLKSIANNEPPAQETLYDQPILDKGRKRITGPFTVEAVPAPLVQPLDTPDPPSNLGASPLDYSIGRSGSSRFDQWRDALLRSGIRGKGGQHIRFSRLETLPGGEDLRYLHLLGETQPAPRNKNLIDPATDTMFDKGEVVLVSFGPEFAPLEQRQVELAVQEAATLIPKPTLLVFAAFQFDSEAAKDIDGYKGLTLLKAQMNADLYTDDLKKKPTNADLFWLIGQPDVQLHKLDDGQYRVAVRGFDYYNPVTGMLESGGAGKIAMWLLDTDYDGRSLFPQQVFFPMAGDKDGWARLGKTLRALVDEDKLEAYRGTVSLPFAAGDYRQAAIKIVDDRGIESIKVVKL
jgi:adenine-specific DNA-methyltransferase